MSIGFNPVTLSLATVIMSQPTPSNGGYDKKSRLGFRAIRAFFLGLGIGFLAFLAVYFMASALNMQAGNTVFNPIALGLVALGLFLLIFLGIEWSEYLQD